MGAALIWKDDFEDFWVVVFPQSGIKKGLTGYNIFVMIVSVAAKSADRHLSFTSGMWLLQIGRAHV